ncbi:MAG: helix-turn-helix transcriptional regulator [Balneolaceae bacterium]
MNIGKGLKVLLKKKNLTQKELAEKINISETSLSLIMQNKTHPRKETLEIIANSLGVKPELLVILSLEKEDIPDNKKEYYSILWPTIESSLLILLQEES